MTLNLSSKEQNIIVNSIGNKIIEVQEVSNKCNIQHLNLANNQIKSLPRNLTNLQSLCLSMNNITSLTSGLYIPIICYQKLRSLDLSHNSLKDIGHILDELPELKIINLFGNKLKTISMKNTKIAFADLAMNRFKTVPELPKTIKEINLDRNYIQTLEFDFSFTPLTKFCVAKNEISFVSFKAHLMNLLTLDISGNKLYGLPNLSKVAPRLRQVDLSSNKMPSLPILPASVTEIHASNNKLRSIPNFVSSLSNLIIADFSHNLIKEISIKLPSSLRSFNIFDNNITNMNYSATNSLPKLYAMQNKLTEIPKISSETIVEYYLSRNCISNIDISILSKCVTRIDISHNNVKELPEELFTIPTLTHLFAGYNQIKEVPESFSQSNLICFSLSGNKLENVPNEFPKTLEELYVADCSISILPKNLSNLEELIELDASSNKITLVPTFSYMKRLNLSKNALTEFPKLTRKIEFMDLSFNNITVIPDGLESKTLRYLNLAYNEITAFPKDALLYRLETLKLQSNPFMSLISVEQFPSLQYLDVSSTTASLDKIPEGETFLACSEPSLCTTLMQRAIVTDDTADYALVRGAREMKEDSVVLRRDLMNGVDLYSLVDGRGGGISSLFAAQNILNLYIKEDDIISEEASTKVYYKLIKKCAKNKVLSIPDYGTAIRYMDELVTVCTGLVSMILVGEEVKEIISGGMVGKPREITTHNKTYGIMHSNYNEGETLIYHVMTEPLVQKRNISSDDKWLIIMSSSVRELLTVDEIATIAKNGNSASEIAYTLKNTVQGNMCCDNISVIVINLSSV